MSLFLLLVPSAIHAAILTGPVANAVNGHVYYLLTDTNWTDSERQAVALGGHLATIRNAAEENWVYTNFNYYGNVVRNLWIGLYDTNPLVNSANRFARRAEFGWISGEPVTYSNWAADEPDNSDSTEAAVPPVWEFYGHIWDRNDIYHGTWNNYQDLSIIFNLQLNGVVEVIPRPTLIVENLRPGKIAFSWPTWGSNFVLESSASPSGTNDWQAVTNAPVIVGDMFTVTNMMSGSAGFYRLRHP